MPRSTQKSEPAETAEFEVEATPETVEPAAAALGETVAAAQPVAEAPKPDRFGRFRVLDKDTGHQLSIHAEALPHGNYDVLDEAASNPATGEPLPPVHQTAVETNPSGQEAENKEELDA
jgi:hypothetical protein